MRKNFKVLTSTSVLVAIIFIFTIDLFAGGMKFQTFPNPDSAKKKSFTTLKIINKKESVKTGKTVFLINTGLSFQELGTKSRLILNIDKNSPGMPRKKGPGLVMELSAYNKTLLQCATEGACKLVRGTETVTFKFTHNFPAGKHLAKLTINKGRNTMKIGQVRVVTEAPCSRDDICSGMGECRYESAKSGFKAYCECSEGTENPSIFGELNRLKCEPNDCAAMECGHGTCVSGEGRNGITWAECKCFEGFEGDSCEIPTCDNVQCGESGTCAIEDGTPECICEDGHVVAENGTCVYDECSDTECDFNERCVSIYNPRAKAFIHAHCEKKPVWELLSNLLKRRGRR